MNLEANPRYLEGTWWVAENTVNYLQLKRKDKYLVVEVGEKAPGREGDR